MSSTVASTDSTKAAVKVEEHFVEIRVAHRGGLPPWAPRKGSTVPEHATLTTRSSRSLVVKVAYQGCAGAVHGTVTDPGPGGHGAQGAVV